MISLHTVFVATLVSQATSTMVLFLFAWSDRRSRGLTQLAFACSIHTAAIALQPLWRNKGLWLAEGIALSLLPLMFFLFHTGLRSFFHRSAHRPVLEKVLLGAATAVIFTMAPWPQLWPMQLRICSLTACTIIAITIRALWNAGTGTVRLHARINAGLMLAIFACFLARLPLDVIRDTTLVTTLRELTMCGISLLAFSFLALYLAEYNRRLHQETRLDALTGLPNRRAMEERAAGQVRLAQRTGIPLALLMMDLDSFKVLNDTWGHVVGDRALRAVGGVLLTAAQGTRYTVARLGGEEFAMLLPGHSVTAAEVLAEHLRSTIAGILVSEGDQYISLTTSIGVAAWDAGEATWTDMLHRADTALYRAKREGRNRVVLFAETMEHTGPAKMGRLRDQAEENSCLVAD